jgi:osmotically-inducible protein OsmY
MRIATLGGHVESFAGKHAAVDRLAWDVAVPRSAVKVKVENGWVTLTGEVDWRYEHQAAGKDVERLFDVVGVSNHTTLKLRLYLSRSGPTRARAALQPTLRGALAIQTTKQMNV